VAAGQCTKVDARARPEAAGLLGCGVMAGLGASMSPARSFRGLGCGLRLRRGRLRGNCGRAPRWSLDDHRRGHRPSQTGGRDAVRSDPHSEFLGERRGRGNPGADGGNGANVCVEAVGNAKVMEQAFFARDLAGTLVQVGVPTPEMRIDLPMIESSARWAAQAQLVRGLPSISRLPILIDCT